jgi:hypothetical protein
MRKHGKKGTISNRFGVSDSEAREESRRRTQLSFESGRQTYRWLSESRRSVPIKH